MVKRSRNNTSNPRLLEIVARQNVDEDGIDVTHGNEVHLHLKVVRVEWNFLQCLS